MKTVRKPSPARSQGTVPRTPIRHKHHRSRSVSSARSNASGRLAVLAQKNKIMDSFALSPLPSRKSILSDNTEIGEPRRKSWWRNLGENSRDVIELLEENNIVEPNNIIEELDIEILSQEKKNYTMDLPESSDSESIISIVIPQRKLFTQKENLPHKKFGEIISTRETLAKLHKPSTYDEDKPVKTVTRELFQNKQRSKPIFPTALLNISPNKTAANKTKDLATLEPKTQVRNIFGNRAPKRKNIFTNFIVSESEDEIPEIQPKVFGFQKKLDARRRGSSSSRGIREPSLTSSITTDIEMDDWKMLPSSTMVENQLEITVADGMSPKKMRLSKLTEIESETGSNATKQSSNAVSTKDDEKSRKSKTFTKEKARQSDLVSQNKSKISHDEEVPDKSRKSKTFIKEKEHQSRSMTTNKSESYQNDDEEIDNQNEPDKDKDKSRKSKTFVKEKTTNLSTMTNKNKSITSQNEDEIVDQPQNKSNPKVTDQNTSHSSIKTRSQNKTNSRNSSKLSDEAITEDTDETMITKNKSKKHAISPNRLNIESKQTPLVPNQESNDDELNFTLTYENDADNHEEMPEALTNNNDKSVLQNDESRLEKSADIEVDVSEVQNDSGVEKSEKQDDENVETNEIEDQNISQEIENASDNEEEQQDSLELQNESEPENESQELEDDNNESQEEPQNESEAELNEVEDQEESEAIAESDNEHDIVNDTDNEDPNQNDSGQVDDGGTQEDIAEIETPNVSHDTTGRNMKNNKSPEVILHNSKNDRYSFAVEGRNTSVRNTEMIKSMHIRPSLESVRQSDKFSDGSRVSNGEGSSWDSHRTARKTLRETYGRDFTPRKSLRALVMEKSAKRQTQHKDVGSDTFKYPQANSTELPEASNRFEDDFSEVDENQVSNHDASLKIFMQEMKKKNAERIRRLEEEVEKSLNAPPKYPELFKNFKVPARPLAPRRATKPKQTKTTLFGQLPAEVIDDLKYKPPKRFQPSDAPWITKRLYDYLESILETKYNYKARIRAEKLVENIYNFARNLRKREVAASDAVDVLKHEMARLGIVKTHFEFYEFLRQFMPREVRVKVNPDVVNKIPLPRHGVFSDIL